MRNVYPAGGVMGVPAGSHNGTGSKRGAMNDEATGEAPVESDVATGSGASPDGGAPAGNDAPRRSRAWLWITIAVLVVLVAGAGGAFAYSAHVKQQRLDTLRAESAKLDAGIQDIFDRSDALDHDWQTAADAESLSDLAALVNRSSKTHTQLLAEVVALKAIAAKMQSAPASADYKSALAGISMALGGNASQTSQSEYSIQSFELVAKAMTAMKAGDTLEGASVRMCNARDFKRGLTEANAGIAKYRVAANAFSSAAELDPVNVDQGNVEYAKQLVVLATMQKTLAELGKRGSFNAYNRQIDKLRAQTNKISKLPGAVTPSLADTVTLVKNGNGELGYAMRAARTDWENAKKHVALGEF